MRPVFVVVPGSIETVSGGYGYDRRMVAGLRRLGWFVTVLELSPRFPRPTPADLDHAAQTLAALPDDSVVVIDGLALGAMPQQASREGRRLRLVGLVHHPLALETGLTSEAAAAFEASERAALAAVRLVVVTSRGTVRTLDRYEVTQPILVAEPGTQPAPLARGSGGEIVQLLSVGSFIPRKGYDVLFRALGKVPLRNWHLTAVGSLDHDQRDLVAHLRAGLRTDGIEEFVTFAGEAKEAAVAPFYDRADVFVLPTLFEGYGMAVAEAVACGLPVVSTPTGAIADLVDDLRSGCLVPPGDEDALAASLTRILADQSFRSRLAEGARGKRATLPSWDDCARTVDAALDRIAGHG